VVLRFQGTVEIDLRHPPLRNAARHLYALRLARERGGPFAVRRAAHLDVGLNGLRLPDALECPEPEAADEQNPGDDSSERRAVPRGGGQFDGGARAVGHDVIPWVEEATPRACWPGFSPLALSLNGSHPRPDEAIPDAMLGTSQ
jgi:hypothetical protein